MVITKKTEANLKKTDVKENGKTSFKQDRKQENVKKMGITKNTEMYLKKTSVKENGKTSLNQEITGATD